MVAYLECFEICGAAYGIEDYADGKGEDAHFFPEKYRSGEYQRFHLWRNGCGIGEAATLAEARKAVHLYATRTLRREVVELEDKLANRRDAIARLGLDPFYLSRFIEQEQRTKTKTAKKRGKAKAIAKP